MTVQTMKRYPSSSTMSAIFLCLMYSFGTFGFLNLFGIRSAIQAILLIFITLIFISMRFKFKISNFLMILIFSFTYTAGSYIYWGQPKNIVDAYILIFCAILIFNVPPKHIIAVCKTLIFSTTILCTLVLIASTLYLFFPEEISNSNIRIYDSMVGQQRIYAGNFIDYISFTSGDGFSILGHQIARMKGYSNEPSSTIVHYVAPAALAFLFGGKYLYLGVFILIVNIIGIVSFTTMIIVFLSLAFLCTKMFPNSLGKIIIFSTILGIIFILMNPQLTLFLFRSISALVLDYAGFDLISRKIGDGTQNSNLGERHQGIIDGFKMSFVSPFGYSGGKLASAGGLYGEIGSRTGWIGLTIFSIFIFHILYYAKLLFSNIRSYSIWFGISLILSILLIVIFVTAYGWLRPAGIIMLLIYYRILKIMVEEISIPIGLPD